jgi:hypothetical protein
MSCPNPDVVEVVVDIDGGVSTATVRLKHCDDARYLYLEVDFVPRGIGAAVDVQGMIWVTGQRGSKEATKKVRFHDNGNVTGYGDQANGIRFQVPRRDYERHHTASPRAFAVR